MAGEFLLTVADPRQLSALSAYPYPRIAMVGRSNVGKSSLLNAIVGAFRKQDMARVSSDPGKTRALHFYHWKEVNKILTDLPGYGFARASHEDRERWAQFINAYFKRDAELERAVVLLDARHGPTDLDLDAIRFLSLTGIPVTFVFTKADLLKTQSERVLRKREAEQALKDFGFELAKAFWVSAKTKDGLKALQNHLVSGG